MKLKIGSIDINMEISSICNETEKFVKLFGLLAKVDSMVKFISEIGVLPEWKEKIRKMEIVRAIHGTLAIEGNDIEIEKIERLTK